MQDFTPIPQPATPTFQRSSPQDTDRGWGGTHPFKSPLSARQPSPHPFARTGKRRTAALLQNLEARVSLQKCELLSRPQAVKVRFPPLASQAQIAQCPVRISQRRKIV